MGSQERGGALGEGFLGQEKEEACECFESVIERELEYELAVPVEVWIERFCKQVHDGQ